MQPGSSCSRKIQLPVYAWGMRQHSVLLGVRAQHGGSGDLCCGRVQVKVEACALEPQPTWSFEHIKVSFEQLSNGQAMREEAFFNGPCTLDSSSPQATLTASRESVWRSYRLTIWTASARHGGTEGDVQLQLEGSMGTSAVLKVLALACQLPLLDGCHTGTDSGARAVLEIQPDAAAA